MAETAKTDTKRLDVTDVARRLKLRYHRARDLILKGEFGPSEREGRHLYVAEEHVTAFEEKRKAAKAAKAKATKKPIKGKK